MDTFGPEIWTKFDRTGKSEFLKQCKTLLKDKESPLLSPTTTSGKSSGKRNGLVRGIYEVLSRAVRGTLKRESALATLTELAHMHHDMPSIILDVIGVMDAETATAASSTGGDATSSQDERNTFCQIVKETEKFLSEKLLKERLEIDTLQDVGTVKNRIFYTKFIKVKTKLYYKQRRFNLFREESEGYAKLITELNQDDCTESEKSTTLQKTLEIIKSLIGCFNLDPNRVLDIILESFETHPEQSKLFIPLLEAYTADGNIICEVLGYKYRHFASDSISANTPQSLYKVTALLLQHSVIQLDDIYNWLSPTDKEMISDWDAELSEAKEFVRKLNVISTKGVEATETTEASGLENGINNNNSTASSVERDGKFLSNQKLGLCEALLLVGDWTTAQVLMKKLPDQSVIVHEPIAKALCQLIHQVIEPVYREQCSLSMHIRGRVVKSHKNRLAPQQATTLDELRAFAFPMFVALGASLHYDPILMYKLIRLCKVVLAQLNVDASMSGPVEEAGLYYEMVTLLDACVLSSLSYLDCNCCLAEEIWSVVRLFPYQYRFCLYGRWKNDTYLMQPKLIRRRGEAQKQIKALMKRVSKENIKPVGRLIGKLSHCSPGFLFDYILLQIQIYDNLIGPVVDSLKYLTSLSYDVLGYCLVEALSRVDLKHDGTSLSVWLQSLAHFCGAVYKKYNIELSGLLQYVANQLKAQKSLDLLILKEVVQKMAGIEAAEEMTNDQLKALCGGEQLRSEAGYFAQVRNTKKSSQRLKDALASNDLSVALCLLIAQQKYCVIYKETANSHLKLVGKLYDQCQDTLVQFGTFLGSTYSVDEYTERLPSIHSMLQEYNIHADVAFFLTRPMFSHQISQKYDLLRKSDASGKKLTTGQKLDKYLEATAEIMNPIVDSVRPLHHSKVWEDISPQFLVTFWSLSMYDLQVPADTYMREINKLKQASAAVMDSKEMNASKGKKEQERYLALIEKLQDEKKKQQEHVDKIMHRLAQEKDSWFLSRSAKLPKNETITQFLQLCLFPRCTFTALDAIYCAKFVHTIHSLKTANFSTLLCYDRIFCDITYCVTSCTENEAHRYGRFLCAMLETVMRWHADQEIFDKECANYPGFVTKFRVSNTFSEANDHVGYENYRHVCHKWHYMITKAVLYCLDSKDYMQIRNAFIILMKILPHYPVITKLAQIIEKRVERVRDEEKNQRQDLFVLASSYIGQLKNRSAQMMREADFHQVTEKVAKEEAAAAAKGGATAAAVNGDGAKNGKDAKKDVTTNAAAKKITTVGGSAAAAPAVASKNSMERETSLKKESSVKKETSIGRENSQQPLSKEKTPKDVRREERHRDRAESEQRKREKDMIKEGSKGRRDKKVTNTTAAVTVEDEPGYYNNFYEGDREDRDRDRDRQQRDLSSVSNSSHGSPHREVVESNDRDQVKRRKVDSGASAKKNHHSAVDEFATTDSVAKKETRSTKQKGEKREKTDEEKELRKERKLGRKRDRAEDAMIGDLKRRKEEEKAYLASKLSSTQQQQHSNGEGGDDSRYHNNMREKSPQYGSGGGRDHRERSPHERVETRGGVEKYSGGGGSGSYSTKSGRTRSGY